MKDAAVKAVPGVSDEMVGYSLLPDTMLTKQQIRWKANRIKDGTYAALSAALPLASVEEGGRSSAGPVSDIASKVAAEIMGLDHIAHRLDEQQQDETHGYIQDIVNAALAHPGAGQPAAVAVISDMVDELAGLAREFDMLDADRLSRKIDQALTALSSTKPLPSKQEKPSDGQ